jgi:gluconokinase
MKSPPISAYQETLGMMYFSRMLDKIRLAATENLRDDFCDNLGSGFDGRCVNFLRVNYEKLKIRTLEGGKDEEILQWCFEVGRELSEGDIYIWNQFLKSAGWRDGLSEILTRRKVESGLAGHDDIMTMLEYFEYDEGRKI